MSMWLTLYGIRRARKSVRKCLSVGHYWAGAPIKRKCIGAVESPEEILSCLKSTVHVHKVGLDCTQNFIGLFKALLNLHFCHYHYDKAQAADLSYMYAGNWKTLKRREKCRAEDPPFIFFLFLGFSINGYHSTMLSYCLEAQL